MTVTVVVGMKCTKIQLKEVNSENMKICTA